MTTLILPSTNVQVIIDVAENADRVGGGAAMLDQNGQWWWTFNGKKTERVPYEVTKWIYASEVAR